MKSIWVIIIALTFFLGTLVSGTIAFGIVDQCANDPAQGKNKGAPFLEIWEAICDLQTQIDTLELTEGPEGPPGPQGDDGPSGEGISCENQLAINEIIPEFTLTPDCSFILVNIVMADINNNFFHFVPANGDGTFDTPINVGADRNNQAIGVADFDKDGNLDVALVSSSTNRIQIHLGDGEGSFGAPTFFGAFKKFGANDLAVGDFNNDSNPDLVVVDSELALISVFLGDGTGSFGAQTNFPTQSAPLKIATADFNGDTNLDIVTGQFGVASVSVLLGDGTGSFGAPAIVPAGIADPIFVQVADFNGDTNMDIVSNSFTNNVSVLLGDGTGSFASNSFTIGTSLRGIVTGDFNGDLCADLLVPNLPRIASTVSFLESDCTGSFLPAITFASGALQPIAMTVSDFDKDGNLDFAVSHFSPPLLAVFLGDGTGSFGAPVSIVLDSNASIQDMAVLETLFD